MKTIPDLLAAVQTLQGDATAPWITALKALAEAGQAIDLTLVAAEAFDATTDEATAGRIRASVQGLQALSRKTWEAHALTVECLRGCQQVVRHTEGAVTGPEVTWSSPAPVNP